MTQTIQSLSESSKTTAISDVSIAELHVVGAYTVGSSAPTGKCEIVVVDQSRPQETIPDRHVSFTELEARLRQIPGMADLLVAERPFVADILYPGELTVRTLRLRRGLTQTLLASMIGTSQPHLARIERGHGDVQRETMRRLCRALEVDMNTLDAALQATSTTDETT